MKNVALFAVANLNIHLGDSGKTKRVILCNEIWPDQIYLLL